MTVRDNESVEKVGTYLIRNELGIHARPAGLFAQTANRFKSRIVVERNGTAVDGKSIMEVMLLGAFKGNSVTVRAIGEDAESALAALAELINGKFGEE